jgi:hypothetical protein
MSVDTAIDQLALPPLARGLPLLGNALDMQRDLIAFLVEQYKQSGPVFRVRALNQEFVVLAGCDLPISLSFSLTHIASNGWLLKPIESYL